MVMGPVLLVRVTPYDQNCCYAMIMIVQIYSFYINSCLRLPCSSKNLLENWGRGARELQLSCTMTIVGTIPPSPLSQLILVSPSKWGAGDYDSSTISCFSPSWFIVVPLIANWGRGLRELHDDYCGHYPPLSAHPCVS